LRLEKGLNVDEGGGRSEKVVSAGNDEAEDSNDIELKEGELESDAEAVAAERTGRTKTAREMIDSTGKELAPGRWDSIGEPGEGLDELQGLYAVDATSQDQLPERGDDATTATGSHFPTADPITPALWDQLKALEGRTVETPKGEPFRVNAVAPGESVSVSPLDGGQEWDVPAQELEAGWKAVNGGARLDRLASIRLQEAGVGSTHPEYVAGLLRAVMDRGT
jgi:hypothetical protein